MADLRRQQAEEYAASLAADRQRDLAADVAAIEAACAAEAARAAAERAARNERVVGVLKRAAESADSGSTEEGRIQCRLVFALAEHTVPVTRWVDPNAKVRGVLREILGNTGLSATVRAYDVGIDIGKSLAHHGIGHRTTLSVLLE